jgi:MoaA/NifB/PqqE/SkfB family radical SAM enzyme
MKVTSALKFASLAPRYVRYRLGQSAPFSAHFEVTNRCTSQGEFCMSWGDQRDHLSTDDCLNIIGKLKKLGVVTIDLFGGEALLRKDIPAMVRHARSLDIIPSVITNGMVRNEKLFRELFEAGLDILTFSLDGARPESHDAYRTNNPFDAVVKTIRFALDLRNQNGYQTKIHTSTVLTNKNISEIADIKRFAEQLGVDQSAFQPVFLQRPDEAAEAKFGLTSDTVATRFGFPPEQAHQASETLLRIRSANLKSYNAMLPDLYTRSEAARRLECYAGRAFVYVDKKGDLFPCSVYLRSFGSLLDHEPKEILNTEHAKTILRSAAKQECGGCATSCFMEKNIMLNGVTNIRQLVEIVTQKHI